MFTSRTEHVVNLPNDGFTEQRKCRRVWRWWNQLTKFQRSLLYMLALIGFITIVYFLPADSNNPVLLDAEQTDINTLKKDLLVHNSLNEDAGQQNDNNARQNVIDEPRHENNNQQESFANNNVNNNNINQIAGPPNLSPVRFTGPSNDRQKAIVDAFKHAWKGYKQFAWGHDHLKPLTGAYQDWFGLGLTIVDSLDTIYIMGLTKGKGKNLY